MKVKEIDRTANIAWSPAAHHPIYLAAGTAAQQLDATFSTTAALEVYSLNLTEPGLDMCMKGSVVSDYRFHKVVWGCEGMKDSDQSSGVIVGGADGGNIMIYDAANLLKGDSAILHHTDKHTGPVHSLDFNKFQDCLLASGASESEVFIWDLSNYSTAPVTLGAKSQPLEEVTSVAWNCQVQHILASTFSARCVVWDLRKNEPIIKVSDSSSRLRCKVVAWHPEVATQLCLASEDDHNPVIQLWDLRFSTSPLKTLKHHQRGILSIAWCSQDPDLLLSCGKDNRILCWNPNSEIEDGEVLCELPAGNQWCFDVAWCPRNPAMIANSSYDGHVGVFSLMGGQQQVQCSSKIAESFPGSETLQAPNAESIHRHISVPLQKPPKWLRKPVGASFGFGGKLVFFGNEPSVSSHSGDVAPLRQIHVAQIITEPELIKKSEKLESALTNGNLIEFCQSKAASAANEQDQLTWKFLEATFSSTPRAQMLSLLGYNYEKVVSNISSVLKSNILDTVNLNEEFSNLTTASSNDDVADFDNIAMNLKDNEEILFIQTDSREIDGLISQALLTGNITVAVEMCIQNERWADALALAQAGGGVLLQKTQKLYFKSVRTNASKLISAIVTSDWLTMVKNCHIKCWKEILAAILTYAKPEDFPKLCEVLGSRLENDEKLQQNATLCYISAGNLEYLAQSWVKIYGNLQMDSLQSLIEQIMVRRRAIEHLTGTSPSIETGMLSSLLGEYAELLATQGNLNSAVTYLVDPNEKTLAILQDRIYQALGLRSPNFPFPRVDVRRTSSASSVQSQPISIPGRGQVQRQSFTQPQQVQQPQYPYGGLPSSGPSNFAYPTPSSTPLYQPSHSVSSTIPSTMMLPQPAPAPPPAPPTDLQSPPNTKDRKNSGSSHLSQRYPRHVQDSSVYNENTYSSNQFYQPQSTAFQPQSTAFQPHSNAFQPQPVPTFYSSPDSSLGNNFQYQPSSTPAQNFQPYNTYTPEPQQPVQSTSVAASNAPPMPLPNCYSDKSSWNDPPPIRAFVPKPPPTSTFENPAPITRPFPDVPEPQMPPYSQAPMSGNYYAPSFPQQAPSGGSMMNPGALMPQPIAEMAHQMPAPSMPEPPKEKGPIPPEHQVLQDTFEDLRRQCQQVATNPQTRRKLDDVAKKLENLYDKLRDNSLTITHGLHQIVQAVMQGDYPSALGIHGHIVSSANFSEISGFIPSLKVLLQTASQLNVYLQ